MKRYLVSSILVAVMVAIALPFVTIEIVSGKGHVPLGQVQVCHKGKDAKNIQATALHGHQRHGDIQLPACDGTVSFGVGVDCSAVVDLVNNTTLSAPPDGKMDLASPNPVTSPACPGGTF